MKCSCRFDQYAADDFWDDEDWEKSGRHRLPTKNADEKTLYVDAHVLASPVIADLDGDGLEELVVPVTYFFDEDYYKEHKEELPKDVDISKYLASEYQDLCRECTLCSAGGNLVANLTLYCIGMELYDSLY